MFGPPPGGGWVMGRKCHLYQCETPTRRKPLDVVPPVMFTATMRTRLVHKEQERAAVDLPHPVVAVIRQNPPTLCFAWRRVRAVANPPLYSLPEA